VYDFFRESDVRASASLPGLRWHRQGSEELLNALGQHFEMKSALPVQSGYRTGHPFGARLAQRRKALRTVAAWLHIRDKITL